MWAGPESFSAPLTLTSTMPFRAILFALGGAVLGFGYQRLIGCRTGTCPLTSHPFITTLYGAFVGLLASGSLR